MNKRFEEDVRVTVEKLKKLIDDVKNVGCNGTGCQECHFDLAFSTPKGDCGKNILIRELEKLAKMLEETITPTQYYGVEVHEGGTVYTYESEEPVELGDIVKVPFGSRDTICYGKVVGQADLIIVDALNLKGIKIKKIVGKVNG